jgi:hypothetical protein
MIINLYCFNIHSISIIEYILKRIETLDHDTRKGQKGHGSQQVHVIFVQYVHKKK